MKNKAKKYTKFKDHKGRKLYKGDTIRYKYQDDVMPKGYDFCEGIIMHEKGAFKVREIGFDYYRHDQDPYLLSEWLEWNKCKKIKK